MTPSKSKARLEHVFNVGQKICEYSGEVITVGEMQRRYGNKTAPYGVSLDDKFDPTKATPADYSRRIIEDAAAIRAFIKAETKIYHGSELFLDYGTMYYLGEEGVQYMTSTRKRPLEKLPRKSGGGGNLPNRFMQSLKKPRVSLFNNSRRLIKLI